MTFRSLALDSLLMSSPPLPQPPGSPSPMHNSRLAQCLSKGLCTPPPVSARCFYSYPSLPVRYRSHLFEGSSLWTLGIRWPIHIPVIAPVGYFPLQFSLWIPFLLVLPGPSKMSGAL